MVLVLPVALNDIHETDLRAAWQVGFRDHSPLRICSSSCTLCYLAIEVDDALEMAEQTEM